MNIELSIDVSSLNPISPRPPYLHQIEYLQMTQKTKTKSFNFKDAPSNTLFVMNVFDHVAGILDAVHSPICSTPCQYYTKTPSNIVSKEGCLKPSKIRFTTNKRRSSSKRASFGLNISLQSTKNKKERRLSIQELALMPTPPTSPC
eukprot:176896_1